jgi:hypothetical protein
MSETKKMTDEEKIQEIDRQIVHLTFEKGPRYSN